MYVTLKNVSAVILKLLLQVTMPAMQLTSLEHKIKFHAGTFQLQWKQITAVSSNNNFSSCSMIVFIGNKILALKLEASCEHCLLNTGGYSTLTKTDKEVVCL